MAQQQSSSDGLLTTAVFAVLLLAGVFVGHLLVQHVLPDTPSAQIIGYVMLPLGVVLGLSFGEGVAPPISVLNLFSVFDHRFSIEQVVSRGGGNGGASSVAVAIAMGTAVTCAALAVVITTFLKPEIGFVSLVVWFGGVGLAYGAVVAGMVWFSTAEK